MRPAGGRRRRVVRGRLLRAAALPRTPASRRRLTPEPAPSQPPRPAGRYPRLSVTVYSDCRGTSKTGYSREWQCGVERDHSLICTRITARHEALPGSLLTSVQRSAHLLRPTFERGAQRRVGSVAARGERRRQRGELGDLEGGGRASSSDARPASGAPSSARALRSLRAFLRAERSFSPRFDAASRRRPPASRARLLRRRLRRRRRRLRRRPLRLLLLARGRSFSSFASAFLRACPPCAP